MRDPWTVFHKKWVMTPSRFPGVCGVGWGGGHKLTMLDEQFSLEVLEVSKRYSARHTLGTMLGPRGKGKHQLQVPPSLHIAPFPVAATSTKENSV